MIREIKSNGVAMAQNQRIIVDADACPKACLAIVQKLAFRFQYKVVTVASFNHQIDNEHHLIVGSEPQAADMAVANLAGAGDVVVTQDLGLAALILGKNAAVLTPQGRIIRGDQIDFILEERDLLARFRRGGGRTKGPAKRTSADDRRFETNLKELLNKQSARTEEE